ncbi:MAG: metallophosphoesterase [Pirellulales bacterium]
MADESDQGHAALSVRRIETDRFVLEFTPREPRPLRILQLTDTHFGNPDLVSQVEDKRSFVEIKRLVERQRPDFIVHTGDFINNDKGPKISFEAIDVFDDLGVPWTHVLGNHDIGARSVNEFRKLMKHSAVGEFRGADGEQYAYRLDLQRSGQAAPDCTLFCFDSGFREPGRKVNRQQLDWFEAQSRRDVEQQIASPALAMIHIPVVEFEKLRAAEKYQGNYGERVCFDNDAGDTFATLKKSSRIRGIFSGHDHENDYHGQWQEVELIYGRVGGWSAYGDLPRGGRLIEIDLAAQTYSHRLVFPEA